MVFCKACLFAYEFVFSGEIRIFQLQLALSVLSFVTFLFKLKF